MKKKRLMRNKESGIIAGVCAGIGDYCHVSPWIFRILFILPVLPFIFTFMAGIFSIVIYVLLAILLPDKQRIEEQNVVEVEYEIIDDNDNDEANVEDAEDFSDEPSEKDQQ
ncbi:PspC domain-containing protein [Acetobacterium paludosum]|uniref:PspC domain-containing protein n=1 Tax=Acetobacterium paludosum TaxID=52693 RepID=A0A923KVE0_9FIRM|nr:PspC domain-containing protein [Acetobacterium paludosum]MBC3886893.1 PspC domain-containing protein [Acetobacterium paludosum]